MAVSRQGWRLYAGAGLALLSIAALLVYRYDPFALNRERLPLVANCQLQLGPCSAPLPKGGSMVFEIKPLQPNPSEILFLRAGFNGIEPRSVGVRFKGVNMNMGQLEYFVHELSRKDTTDGSIVFAGEGGVFVCALGRMRWHALVKLQIGEQAYEVPFEFETINPGFSPAPN